MAKLLPYTFDYKPGRDKAADALSCWGGWLAGEELMAISSPLFLDLNVIQQEVDVDEDESFRKLKENIVSSRLSKRGFFVEKGVLLSKIKSYSHAIMHSKTDFLRNIIPPHGAVTQQRKRLTNIWLLIYIVPA